MTNFRSRLLPATLLAEMKPTAARAIVRQFGDDVSDEARNALKLRGRVLGSEGTSRTAYVHKTDPSLCIKVAVTDTYHKGRTDANQSEAANWRAVAKHPELAKWFAPVRWISVCGFVLFQDRAKVWKDGVPRNKFPKQMPGIFELLGDMHVENFGFIGDQIVCIDYPNYNVPFAARSTDAKKMLNVWWNSPTTKFPSFTEYESAP